MNGVQSAKAVIIMLERPQKPLKRALISNPIKFTRSIIGIIMSKRPYKKKNHLILRLFFGALITNNHQICYFN